MSERQRYLAAARTYVEQVAAIPNDAWGRPGLGDWDLRALVGHASRSLVTVLTYLDQPAEEPTVDSAADYYLVIGNGSFDPGDVTARGVAAGEAMGDDPAAFVAGLAARRRRPSSSGSTTTTCSPRSPGRCGWRRTSRPGPSSSSCTGWTSPRATGQPVEHPPECVAEAVALAGAVAVRSGKGPDLLLALTGRAPLPAGFSIV